MRIQVYLLFFILISACQTANQSLNNSDISTSKREILAISTIRQETVKNMSPTPLPPGTIEIQEGLYFDKSEITVIGYAEYLFWLKVVYGEDSDKYKLALADTAIWSLPKRPTKSNFGNSYFTHPAYNDYPIVGISYAQATAYAAWRSDRLMENILINRGLIDGYEIRQGDTIDPAAIFTIQKYFNGTYKGIQPDSSIKYYPQYSLPDSNTFYLAATFADSLNQKNYKSCKKKFCEEDRLLVCHCLGNSAQEVADFIKPTSCIFCKKPLITHLKGNVREMTKQEGHFYGLSFMDSPKSNYNRIRIDSNFVNCYTGFRNMCKYIPVP